MKICWDNLENIKLTKSGNFRNVVKEITYKYKKCPSCEEYFLSGGNSICCSYGCVKKTDIQKKKISKAMSGVNNPWYGKKRPDHSKKMSGINNYYYGKGYLLKGKNNPNWKGGISKSPYCEGWKLLTKELTEHYNQCMNSLCEGKGTRLTNHHIDYNKQNCHPKNLITLCNVCNAIANGNRDFWEIFYKELKNVII